MRDVRVLRAADAGSDHHPVLCKMPVKLRRTQKEKGVKLFDSERLRNQDIKEKFTLELSNRFQILGDLSTEDIEDVCSNVHEVFLDTSKKVLGYRKGQKKKEWISETTWQLVEERRTTKQCMLTGSEAVRKTASEAYRVKDKAVKKSARKDKRDYTDSLATEAQTAAEKGDTRTVYRITKSLSGGSSRKTTAVKDKNGEMLMKDEDQLNRWAEHFKEVLNRPDPEEEASIEETGQLIEMKRGHITQQEIMEAIRQTKSNKAPGEDKKTYMLKANALKDDNQLNRPRGRSKC